MCDWGVCKSHIFQLSEALDAHRDAIGADPVGSAPTHTTHLVDHGVTEVETADHPVFDVIVPAPAAGRALFQDLHDLLVHKGIPSTLCINKDNLQYGKGEDLLDRVLLGRTVTVENLVSHLRDVEAYHTTRRRRRGGGHLEQLFLSRVTGHGKKDCTKLGQARQLQA
jgi:hypothetical protein